WFFHIIINELNGYFVRKRAAEGVTELIARGYRIEYIYILLELNHPCSRSCPIIEAVILTDYIIAKHNPGMQ
ncbi:TPA: hypothetical protein ACRGIX_005500, partial [Klebsiella pneumoniae]